MNVIAAILIISIALKDVVFIGDPYILRGISQGLCLIISMFWLLCNANVNIIKIYKIVFFYIIVILFSGIFSSYMEYVLMQLLSLISVLIFSICYFEDRNINKTNLIYFIDKIVLIVLTFLIMSSLLLAIVKPEMAFGNYYAGDLIGNEKRFNGILPKPSMMAASAGILLGLSFFNVKTIWIKFAIFTCGCACLILTGSRTFWVSTIISLVLTIYFYGKNIKMYRYLFFLLSIVVLLFGSYYEYNLYYKTKASDPGIIRAGTENINKLSGRTEIWKMSFDVFLDSPVIGYGFTIGAEKLIGQKKLMMFGKKIKDVRALGGSTLHNGYVQALLDTGICGFLFYITIVYLSLYRVWKYDYKKIYPGIFYMIVFFSISNLGETIIYSAGTFNSCYYWINSIAALSLRNYST